MTDMRARPKLSAPITLRELVALLGWPDRSQFVWRAKRMLRARERSLRAQGHEVTLYHCHAAGAVGTVTLAQLRTYMPELFSARDEIVAAVRAEVEDVREGEAENRARSQLLAQHVLRLETRVSALEARLRRAPRPDHT